MPSCLLRLAVVLLLAGVALLAGPRRPGPTLRLRQEARDGVRLEAQGRSPPDHQGTVYDID